mgnify:CR=1 FL=1
MLAVIRGCATDWPNAAPDTPGRTPAASDPLTPSMACPTCSTVTSGRGQSPMGRPTPAETSIRPDAAPDPHIDMAEWLTS